MFLPIHFPKKLQTPLILILFISLVACDIWRATPPVAAQGEEVTLTITDDRTQGQPGETVTYKVIARNQTDRELNGLKITVHIPDYLVPSATSPAAQANTEIRTLVWDHQILSAKGEATFGFQAKFAAETPRDTTLHTTAHLEGSGVRTSATDNTTIQKTPAFKIADKAAITSAPTPIPAVAPSAQTGTASVLLLITLTGIGATMTAGFSSRLLRSR